jgi:hypothetical protein
MSVEHLGYPYSIDVPRSFEWKGGFYYFSDEQWAKITDMVKAPASVQVVTLMCGSKAHLEVKKLASELLKKSPH